MTQMYINFTIITLLKCYSWNMLKNFFPSTSEIHNWCRSITDNFNKNSSYQKVLIVTCQNVKTFKLSAYFCKALFSTSYRYHRAPFFLVPTWVLSSYLCLSMWFVKLFLLSFIIEWELTFLTYISDYHSERTVTIPKQAENIFLQDFVLMVIQIYMLIGYLEALCGFLY